MSTERNVAYLLRSWMRSDSDGTVDHVVDAILAEVDTTPQRRATRWPARRPIDMNTIVKYGIAAAVLAMAAVLGYGIWQNIGNQPAPDPEASEEAGPGSDLPTELRRLFIGQERVLDELSDQPFVTLDLISRVYRTSQVFGVSRLMSAVSLTSADELRLETVAEGTGCAVGDVGIYPYELSIGGTRLVIDPGADDCEMRSMAVVGAWRLMDCANTSNWCQGPLEAGSQTSLFFDPFRTDWGGQVVTRNGALTYVVPDGWSNASDQMQSYTVVRTIDYEADGFSLSCLDCADGIWMGASPMAVEAGCSEDADPDVGISAREIADWLRAHPALEVTEGRMPSVAVDGRPTIILDIEARESYADACNDPVLERSFIPLFAHAGYTVGIGTGDAHRVILVELGPTSGPMVIVIDSFDPADLDAVIEETQPIIDSIQLNEP